MDRIHRTLLYRRDRGGRRAGKGARPFNPVILSNSFFSALSASSAVNLFLSSSDLSDASELYIKAYNDFVGSFETRIVSSARKFKDLGADSPKELPADPAAQIETIPREVKQPASTD